ncbi:MAG: hypothetical protein JRJ62_15450 [Deltaproteobacteria bacterium]|nr:hypothetical protein [Deltaproteobacteria bacterium]
MEEKGQLKSTSTGEVIKSDAIVVPNYDIPSSATSSPIAAAPDIQEKTQGDALADEKLIDAYEFDSQFDIETDKYGEAKPFREIIRGKIIYDKD